MALELAAPLSSWLAYAAAGFQAHPLLALGALALAALLLHAAAQTRRLEAVEDAFIKSNLARLAELAAAAAAAPHNSPPPPPLTALVSGASSGIGLALCEQLAACGVRVLLGCRSPVRGAAALARVADAGAAAGHGGLAHELVVVDVANPGSVLGAAAGLLRRGADAVHLDFLVLNAGIMPVAHYRWSVILHALATGRIGHFLATSRAHARGPSFLIAPLDSIAACGAPLHLAAHVLGHLLLAEELQPLMRPMARGEREGRVIWTGSRSSCVPPQSFAMRMLEPPEQPGAPSGFEQLLASGGAPPLLDSYGQAKYVMDLVNAALARRVTNPCAVVCPGFVDTALTPPFFAVGLPLLRFVRRYAPSMVLTGRRGTAAHVSLMVAQIGGGLTAAALSESKWTLSPAGDRLVHAAVGAPPLPLVEQERVWAMCQQWLAVWRASVGASAGSGAGDVGVGADTKAHAPPYSARKRRNSLGGKR